MLYRSRLLVLMLIGVLAACGQQSNPRPPQGTTPLTPQEAKAVADAAVADLALTGAMLTDESAALSAQGEVGSLAANAQSWGMPLRMGYVLEATGTYIPAARGRDCDIKVEFSTKRDGDRVTTVFGLTFNCEASKEGKSYTTQGTINYEETRQNGRFVPVLSKLEFKGFKVTVDDGKGNKQERTFDGSFNLDASDPALYKSQKNYTYARTLTENGKTDSGSTRFAVEETYAPDNKDRPLRAGTLTVDKAKPGTLEKVKNNETKTLTWNTDPTLHWNRGECRSWKLENNFDKGAVVFNYTAAGKTSVVRIEFTACGEYTVTVDGKPVDPNDKTANVRAIHASSDAPAVNVRVDDKTAFSGLTFKNASPYAPVQAGKRNVKVNVAPDGPTVINADVTVEAGKDYTILAVGKATTNPASIAPLVLTDDNKAPAEGKTKVRLVHAASGVPTPMGAVDVYVTAPNTDLANEKPTLEGFEFKDASPYLEVPAGAYQVRITLPGSKTVAIDTGALNLEAGKVYTGVALDPDPGSDKFQAALFTDK